MAVKEAVMAVVDRLIGNDSAVKMKPFTYNSGAVPQGYKCSVCGKEGVKLWREYQTFLDHQSLSCADCALERAAKNHKENDGCRYAGPVTADGYVTVFYSVPGHDGDRSDQIGWLVPAVPTEDGETFWGYTSVPDAGVQWWRKLPSYPVPKG